MQWRSMEKVTLQFYYLFRTHWRDKFNIWYIYNVSLLRNDKQGNPVQEHKAEKNAIASRLMVFAEMQ